MPSLFGGGAERVMANLALGIARTGRDVDLVLVEATGSYLPLVEGQDRIRIVDLGRKRALTSLPALVRYLRRSRPACLISALNYANLIAVWARQLSGVPTRLVLTVHNQLSGVNRKKGDWRHRLEPSLMRHYYPKADAVVAVSDGVADDLRNLLGPRREVTTIYNPVVMPEMFERARAEPEHAWFRDGGPPVLVGMGRLTEQKDFETLLRAFQRVHTQAPSRLMILGEGPEEPRLRQLAKELDVANSVAFPGFVDNPYAYLSRAQLFVLSSRWEGLPTVLIEALALGTPVVATDCRSGPKEILESGRWGTLVGVGDAGALAQAITAALQKPVPVDAARVADRFSLQAATDAYLKVSGLLSDQARSSPFAAGAVTNDARLSSRASRQHSR